MLAQEELDQLVRLVARVYVHREPVPTAEGLRRAIELVLKLAEFAGLDPSIVARLRAALLDESLFPVVLAIVRYLTGLAHLSGARVCDPTVRRILDQEDLLPVGIGIGDLLNWLPLLLEIIDLIRRRLQNPQ